MTSPQDLLKERLLEIENMRDRIMNTGSVEDWIEIKRQIQIYKQAINILNHMFEGKLSLKS